ncbi:MAG: TIGR01244 family phosphatase [Alphaproteobacteria bacterium]|nr:TIGR01244 family phosphatase [Alphaproteobacteria bacterium]
MPNQDNSPFSRLTDDFLVAAQLTTADIAKAKSAGVALIINNRPDGEEPGQPRGEAIAAAAAEEGIRYVEIPIGRTGVTAKHLDDFEAATSTGARTLAYCRSGMRSTIVWAMAKARTGGEIDQLVEQAAAAGYDISAQRRLLEAAKSG